MTRAPNSRRARHQAGKALGRVAIFARAPQLGRVKTRLARTVGDAAALAAYEELLAVTLTRLAPTEGDFAPEIWVEGDAPAVAAWRRTFPVHGQVQGNLGARMAAAFEAGVSAVVGADIPAMTAAYVDDALGALDGADVVLGPTEDGGYCLIAMREPHTEVFADIPWSTPGVLQATLAKAAHLCVAVQETLWDVDDEADLKRWRESGYAPPAQA